MGVKRCKLREKTQRKLLEFFVLEVPARAAADLLGLQANTTTLFYRKLRVIIAEKLEHETSELAGEIELMKIILVACGKGSANGARREKFQCLASQSGVGQSIHRLLITRALTR